MFTLKVAENLERFKTIERRGASLLPDPVQPPAAQAPRASNDGEHAQPEAFRSLMQGIGVLAGLTHVSFCALFLWAKVDFLAWINIGSVLSYVWVFVLARQGRVERAWAVTVIEVLGHAILAELLIGWDSGFHYYVLLVIPVAVISSIKPLVLKAATVVGVMVAYLMLDVVMRTRVPPYDLPEIAVSGLHYFNVVGVMVILVFLAGFYYYLINEAEVNLRAMATTDPLTQLRNRRSISEIIHFEQGRLVQSSKQLSFILCDLDHFKGINDTRGHEAGDAVLKAVGQTLSASLREVDHVARWGGEEFLAVLPETDSRTAMMVAERLRLAVEQLAVPQPGGGIISVTLTAGVATLWPDESAQSAISRADTALYAGKHGGRNRVIMAADPPTNTHPA